MRVLALLLLVACSHPAPPAPPPAPPVEPAHVVAEPPPPAEVPDENIDSTDILARDAGTTPVLVKHVLIGWKALDDDPDPRAKERSNAQAAAL
ncbi:MAG TPA: hypothetical protein VGM39_04575, partial [Kofleriaceae bacterium]